MIPKNSVVMRVSPLFRKLMKQTALDKNMTLVKLSEEIAVKKTKNEKRLFDFF